MPYLPQCCQRSIPRQSKPIQSRPSRIQSNAPQQIRVTAKNDGQNISTIVDETIITKLTTQDTTDKILPKERISLLPK